MDTRNDMALFMSIVMKRTNGILGVLEKRASPGIKMSFGQMGRQ